MARKLGFQLINTRIQDGHRPPSWRWLQIEKMIPQMNWAVLKHSENILNISLCDQNYQISVFSCFQNGGRRPSLMFKLPIFNYIVTSLGIFHIFEITRNVWWFHIPWLAKKLRFLLKFRKSKMDVGRHLEDDFKTKIWYQNWIQWCWNTRKMYFTLVHHIKIN